MDEFIQQSQPRHQEFPTNSNIYMTFQTSTTLLKYLKIPKIQREIDTLRIDKLAENISNEFLETGIYDFGTLMVCFLDDECYLLNGQHRYHALKQIISNHENTEIQIKVEVREAKDEAHMNSLWKISNSSIEVKIAKNSNHQLIVNGIRKHLMEKYPSYISTARNPHKPNINLDTLCEKMEEIDLITSLSICSAEQITELMEEINKYYRDVSIKKELWGREGWGFQKKDLELIGKSQKKSPTKTFYLGIYSQYEWINRILDHVKNNIVYDQMPHRLIASKSRKINNKLRHRVWKKRNQHSTNGICFVCHKSVDDEEFQCGHIRSHFYGGEANIDNLEPICGSCNRDMGIENLNDYKNREYPNNN